MWTICEQQMNARRSLRKLCLSHYIKINGSTQNTSILMVYIKTPVFNILHKTTSQSCAVLPDQEKAKLLVHSYFDSTE